MESILHSVGNGGPRHILLQGVTFLDDDPYARNASRMLINLKKPIRGKFAWVILAPTHVHLEWDQLLTQRWELWKSERNGIWGGVVSPPSPPASLWSGITEDGFGGICDPEVSGKQAKESQWEHQCGCFSEYAMVHREESDCSSRTFLPPSFSCSLPPSFPPFSLSY